MASLPILAVVFLSCSPDQVSAPLPDIALKHRDTGGNPDCQLSRRHGGHRKTPVDFLCAIEIPGNPLTSSQKGWAEQSNGTYFLSDASNSGVDVIDIKTHTFAGRISGFVGNVGTGGGTSASNGAGPNAFVSTPARRGHGDDDDDDDDHQKRLLWVSDGNSTVRVVDVDSRQIIASVSTAIAACDGGTATTKYCGRSNEIAYDPEHHVVLVSNPNPLSHVKCTAAGANCTNNAGVTAAGAALEGYATFISARHPYHVLGQVFPGPGTVEGHVWVPQLNRFLLPMQGVTPARIAVINSRTRQIEGTRVYTCSDIPGTVPGSAGNNNLQLAGRNLWAQMCGRPIRMDVRTGVILSVVTQVGTGDQDWYNPGDGNFYVTGADATTGVSSLGVMDAKRGTWLQNVPNVQGASPTAYARTNEIFTRATVNAAMVANPALDLSRCVVKGRGCVVVFAHVGGGDEDDDDEDEDEDEDDPDDDS